MTRLDFLNQIYGMCKGADWHGTARPKEIMEAVNNYRRKSGKRLTLSSYKIAVIDGCLYLNNDFVLRIEPRIRPFNIDNLRADYYEDLCIGRSES